MSNKLGSLYIKLGEPEGELCGCTCEVGGWAADEIERLHAELAAAKNREQSLREALESIARANWHTWYEEVRSADAFVSWAKNRAWFALDSATTQARKDGVEKEQKQ